MSGTKQERLACLIAGRNLGDIVILSDALMDLMAANYAERYIVWTRPQMEKMFSDIPGCEVVCSAFPVGTRKEFDARGLRQWLAAIRIIRAQRPSVSIDFVGDFRERGFARLIGSGRHRHIGWERGHPYANLIRNPFGTGTPLITIPASVPNVYDAHRIMIRALIGREVPCAALDGAVERKQPVRHPEPSRIGLHPFASQECKKWPNESWRRLAQALLSFGCRVVAFSAPSERAALEEIFAGLDGRMSMTSGTLQDFMDAVSQLDLLIGLDSFSVHLAHRIGIPSITINAGAPADLWAVPSGRTVAQSGGCAFYPCYNIAPCRGKDYEYACVRAVKVEEVLAAVESSRVAGRSIGCDEPVR